LFAITLILCPYILASADNSYIATLSSVKGEVAVDLDSQDRWDPGEVGIELKSNSKIKTGENSYADIVFGKDKQNMVTLGDETTLSLNTVSSINLLEGKILAAIKKVSPKSKFEVRTPSAVCGIHGSLVGIKVFGSITKFLIFKGKADIQSLDMDGNPLERALEIKGGWKSIVSEGKDPYKPAKLDKSDEQIWEEIFETNIKTEAKIEKEEVAEMPEEEKEEVVYIKEEPLEPERPEASPYKP